MFCAHGPNPRKSHGEDNNKHTRKNTVFVRLAIVCVQFVVVFDLLYHGRVAERCKFCCWLELVRCLVVQSPTRSWPSRARYISIRSLHPSAACGVGSHPCCSYFYWTEAQHAYSGANATQRTKNVQSCEKRNASQSQVKRVAGYKTQKTCMFWQKLPQRQTSVGMLPFAQWYEEKKSIKPCKATFKAVVHSQRICALVGRSPSTTTRKQTTAP